MRVVYTNKGTAKEERKPVNTRTERELNVIVHGIREDDARPQTDQLVTELFETIGVEQHRTTLAHRLGSKSTDRIRPVKITLESSEKKSEFMSKLWKLKYGSEKFQKISITEDFTQDERNEIKLWVEEAKQRTRKEDKYIWKVRGSPRTKISLVKMSKP